MASKTGKKTSGRPVPTGGRVTPKGGAPRRGPSRSGHGDDDAWESGRYARASSNGTTSSPRWWPVLLFGLLGMGMLLIILDYTGVLPGSPNNWMLLPAFACIGAAFLAAMSYR